MHPTAWIRMWVWPMGGSNLNIFSNITSTFYPYQILMDMYYGHTIAVPHAPTQKNNMAEAENNHVANLVI